MLIGGTIRNFVRPLLVACIFAALALSAGSVRAASFSTVVIDAGHGGHDNGGIPSNIIPEKGVALDVARRLQNILEAYGLRTVMTRSDDTFIPLPQRVAIANAQKHAIFVSIHFNAAPNRDGTGIETYYGPASAKRLAMLIQADEAAATNERNRGVKHADYYVLRKTKIPAVLVECGFLTNPGDAARAQTKAYRELVARQIARGILQFRSH
jgi:N-acetylmuramoyl-L-alanine amidase